MAERAVSLPCREILFHIDDLRAMASPTPIDVGPCIEGSVRSTMANDAADIYETMFSALPFLSLGSMTF
ncbi:MAG TPA: hypothetical protein VFG09_08570 [Thermodesulfovibrionales bacterium]|jgi:hypothetical protein|nr:hypothetical protein [Thermodesulfovibrionales bacterium]